MITLRLLPWGGTSTTIDEPIELQENNPGAIQGNTMKPIFLQLIYTKISMHDLRGSVSFQVDIFSPASKV